MTGHEPRLATEALQAAQRGAGSGALEERGAGRGARGCTESAEAAARPLFWRGSDSLRSWTLSFLGGHFSGWPNIPSNGSN